jgi:hypothetical protein
VNKNLRESDIILEKKFDLKNIKVCCIQSYKLESDTDILFKDDNESD